MANILQPSQLNTPIIDILQENNKHSLNININPFQDLHLFNSLDKSKQVFISRTSGQLSMYVCGMTVYDYCHIGHARVLVVFDVIQKWFKQLGYKVTYVRNITDIDDKIITRAHENNESIYDLTSRFITAMHEDSEKLGIEPPTHQPKATDYIAQMHTLIEKLMDKQLAYQQGDGDVYFSVQKFARYGQLSGRNLQEMQGGERISEQEKQAKLNELDFVLWKQAKEGDSIDSQWASPWGSGRPGWHIECSAMSCGLLGEQFDIHGGGFDLQFPHHENEIAQSEGALLSEEELASNKRWVNYWLHNGFVKVNDEKMSKSLGNFFTIRDVLKHYSAEVVRFLILKSHYRSSLNYNDGALNEAKHNLIRLYKLQARVLDVLENSKQTETQQINFVDVDLQFESIYNFYQAMNDDFNTPKALAILFELMQNLEQALKLYKQINENIQSNSSNTSNAINNLIHIASLSKTLSYLSALLGIGLKSLDAVECAQPNHLNQQTFNHTLTTQWIEAQIALRKQAKLAKDFAQADKIRQDLLAQGIELIDLPNQQTYYKSIK